MQATAAELQLSRFQLCAHNILTEFYQAQRFYVLPELPDSFRRRVVYFPRVSEYLKDFAHYATLDNFHASELPKNIQVAIAAKLDNIQKIYARKIALNAKLISHFSKKLQNRIDEIKKLIGFDPAQIFIVPQLTGTIGSYSIYLDREKMYLLPRFDATESDLYSLLLQAAMHRLHYFSNETITPDILHAISLIVAALKSNKLLKKLFPPVHPTHELLKQNYCARLIAETVEYLAEIGIPLESQLSSPDQIPNATEEERNFLALLLANRRNMVSKAAIAQAIWSDKRVAKYSEFALSKLIERTRAKLKEAGLSEHLIHTQRAKGAVLFD